MANLLLVEDEAHIREILQVQLAKDGHNVTSMVDGQQALDAIQNDPKLQEIDLFILDRMLPGASGTDLCRFLRMYKATKFKPILLLTALAKPEDIVIGLDAGADDYLTKPFENSILLARVRALLRRRELSSIALKKNEPEILQIGGVKLDTQQCQVWLDGQQAELTLSEYKLLLTFMRNAGKVFTRNQLVESIQEGPVHVTDRTIDTHIFGLRKKLGDHAVLIETIRGVGYRVKPHE